MENDLMKDCGDALVKIWDARKKLIEAELAYERLVNKMR